MEAGTASPDESQDLHLITNPEGLHCMQNIWEIGTDVFLHCLNQIHQEEHDPLKVRRVTLLALHRANEGRDDKRKELERSSHYRGIISLRRLHLTYDKSQSINRHLSIG